MELHDYGTIEDLVCLFVYPTPYICLCEIYLFCSLENKLVCCLFVLLTKEKHNSDISSRHTTPAAAENNYYDYIIPIIIIIIICSSESSISLKKNILACDLFSF